jgi:ornithine cyclodeaminase/alanine dehydrogenase-like protein (mu-crystallin family)
VRSLLPGAAEQLALVEDTYRAMHDGTVQLPPKPAIHPREGTFLHAMPAYLGEGDVTALKWIGGSTGNKARGLPYLSGLIIVNDSETAAPLAIIDAAEITAARTAAVTGLCVRQFAVEDWQTVAIVGFGEQGRAHAQLLRAMNEKAQFAVFGGATADDESSDLTIVGDARSAVTGADVVVTAIPFHLPAEPIVEADWIADSQLVLPIDFDASVAGSVAEAADLFVVDDIATFEYYRGVGHFEGWPTPTVSLAEVLGDAGRPTRAVCCNLGVATLDAAFASCVLERAHALGVGALLDSAVPA